MIIGGGFIGLVVSMLGCCNCCSWIGWVEGVDGVSIYGRYFACYYVSA